MRNAVFAVLLVIPIVLVGWIVWRGTTTSRSEGKVAIGRTMAAREANVAKDDHDKALRSLLEGLNGVKLVGDIIMYDDKTLFDAINGEAPIFIERNFRKLAGQWIFGLPCVMGKGVSIPLI